MGKSHKNPKQCGGPPSAASVGSHDHLRPEGTKGGDGVTWGVTLGSGVMEVGPLGRTCNHRGSSPKQEGMKMDISTPLFHPLISCSCLPFGPHPTESQPQGVLVTQPWESAFQVQGRGGERILNNQCILYDLIFQVSKAS